MVVAQFVDMSFKFNIKLWTSKLGQICPKADNFHWYQRNFDFHNLLSYLLEQFRGSNFLKILSSKPWPGHWLWLSQSPGQAKANSRQDFWLGLGLACVLGLAWLLA